MKNKKWVYIMLLILIMIFNCIGCNKGDAKLKTSEESNKKLITVGVAQLGSESAWRLANTESIKNAGTEENGINLIFENAEGDQKKQIQILEDFIKQKVDVIVLAPCVEDGWDDILKKAKEAEIPVMLVDRTINVKDESLYECWIGSDFLLEGYYAGDWIKNYMDDLGQAGNTHNIAVLQGTIGATAEVGRTKGIHEMFEDENNYNIVYEKCGDFSFDGGKKCMNEIITSNLNVDILVSQNDDMSLGAIEAMEEAGLQPGKDITIISFDGVKAAFEAMVQGKINCTVECNPLSGDLIMESAKKIANGETVEKKVYVLEGIYPADTAKDYIESRKY